MSCALWVQGSQRPDKGSRVPGTGVTGTAMWVPGLKQVLGTSELSLQPITKLINTNLLTVRYIQPPVQICSKNLQALPYNSALVFNQFTSETLKTSPFLCVSERLLCASSCSGFSPDFDSRFLSDIFSSPTIELPRKEQEPEIKSLNAPNMKGRLMDKLLCWLMGTQANITAYRKCAELIVCRLKIWIRRRMKLRVQRLPHIQDWHPGSEPQNHKTI